MRVVGIEARYVRQGGPQDKDDVSAVGPSVSCIPPINKSGVFCCRNSQETKDSQRMNRLSAITETLVSRDHGSNAAHISSITLGAAVVCTVWYAAVSLVCAVGYTQL